MRGHSIRPWGSVSGSANMNLLPAELSPRMIRQASVAPAQVHLQASNAEGVPTASPAYGFNQPDRGAAPTYDDLLEKGVGTNEAQGIVDSYYSRELGGGMSKAELQDFEALIGRLESSKMRQAGQGNRARQRETFAKGLANMMKNF